MELTPLQRQRAASCRVWQADAATRPRGDWADLGGLAAHTTGIPVRHWNGVHLTAPEGLEHLDRAAAWFAQRGMPWGLLVPDEMGVTPDLVHLTTQRVMLRDLAGLPAVPDLDLRWTGARAAAKVQSAAFGGDAVETEAFVTPKLVNSAAAVVTAYDGSTPVSTATLFVVDGVAAVFGVATIPSHERQGLGRGVTVAVLHEAVRRGADLAYLNPTDAGYPVYRELGFADAPPFQVFSEP